MIYEELIWLVCFLFMVSFLNRYILGVAIRAAVIWFFWIMLFNSVLWYPFCCALCLVVDVLSGHHPRYGYS